MNKPDLFFYNRIEGDDKFRDAFNTSRIVRVANLKNDTA